MASFEDELLEDAQYDAAIVEYVRQQIPQELKEKFNDETLYYFHDLVEEFLAESDVLEEEADENGFVEIDIEEIAKYIQKKAAKEGIGDFEVEDLLFPIEAEMSFGDDFEDE